MLEWFSQIGDLLDYGWDIGEWYLTRRMILFSGLIILGGFILRRFIVGNLLSFIRNKGTIEERDKSKLQRIINIIVFAATFIGVLKVLGLDYTIHEFYFTQTDTDQNEIERIIPLRITSFFLPIIIFKLAQLIDLIFGNILLDRYYNSQLGSETQGNNEAKSKANKTIQYLVYAIAIVTTLKYLKLDVGLDPLKDGGHFTLTNTLEAITTLLIAWLIIWVMTNIILQSYYKRKNVDVGNQYAFNQLLKYVVYVIAMLIALQNNLHFNLNILLGGAAALLVGIGLGLQQTFNDLISGIILLFERTIEVGDVVEVGGLVGTVTRIGIRTSVVLIRDNTSVVVPNSKFITDNVVNWSHNDEKKVRFQIAVGVAYGSDTELVKKTLLKVADENPDVLQRPASFVRFVDFADSSLNFELHFWSRNFIRIEDVKSDLRFQIDADFRKNGIEIPFPQRVVWSAGHTNDAD